MKRYLILVLFFPFSQSLCLNMKEVREIRQEISNFRTYLSKKHTEEIFTSYLEDEIIENFNKSLIDIKEDKYNNKKAHKISDLADNWGIYIKEKYKEIIVDSIVVDLSENMSYWYDNSGTIYTSYWANESKLIYTAKIAIGDEEIGRGTKIDKYIIGKKASEPKASWKQRNLEVPYGHPFNPLGARKLELWKDGEYTFYTCHGTNDTTSIGKHISLGCIRFHNIDILILYELVGENKTIVVIKE